MTLLPSFSQPSDRLREVLAAGAPVCLPVNPIEYHGPHLPLNNDSIISAGLARELNDKLIGAHPEWTLVNSPDLGLGVNPVPGPGSRHTPFRVLRRLVEDACAAIADLGARRVILMTFHGDPLHNLALEAGVQLLRQKSIQALAPMHVLLREIMAPDDARLREVLEPLEDAPAGMLESLRFDLHAGFAETSLTLHYAPEAVSSDLRNLPPCPPFSEVKALSAAAKAARAFGRDTLATELAFAARGLGWYRLRPFPGYTGNPRLANAASGAILARLIVDEFVSFAERVFSGGPPPAPVMPWLAKLPHPKPFVASERHG